MARGLPARAAIIGSVLSALLCPTAHAETLKGVALAIGQSDYETISDLGNTGRDARGIEDLLARLGFETDAATDRNARQLSRDLEGFAEDAEGADVAVLYYAGHAVEIGGRNYLLPTDIDASSPDALAAGLVPLSETVDALRRNAKLVIVLLDACRDNPLPPGITVRLTPEGEPQAVTMVGAGTRGVTMLSRQSDPSTGSLGIVVGFAAEPGKVALDGEPGGNSPYAAALLRHIPAMAGAEFGQVMRMVGQEVYLKTNGRQRPWVNESLQQFLYFGEPAPDPTGDEGDILKERRQLLLTIADLPDFRRQQVERVASDGNVPMDSVFGMLRAMGSETPQDASELEKLLRIEAERFAKILANREAIASQDSEIVRLTALADSAESEGLLAKADELRERAKARVQTLRRSREAEEELLRQRNVEDAEVYARSAETKTLKTQYLTAAADYAEAFRIIEGWDARLAWQYKQAETIALTYHGDYKGENSALVRAIHTGRQAVALAESLGDRDLLAKAQTSLGRALGILGEREGGTTRLQEAIVALRAALELRSRQLVPLDWAAAQNELGVALRRLGEREPGIARLEEAAAAYRAALQERSRARAPLDWAMTEHNLGTVLRLVGERDSGIHRLEESVVAYRAALEERTRERVPLDWAATNNALGIALRFLGTKADNTTRLLESVAAYRSALQERTRERVPLQWATTQNNLGSVLQILGAREGDTARLEEAVVAYRAALQEHTRSRVPLDWAMTQNNLGNALSSLAEHETGTTRLEDAIAAYRAALEEWTRERWPLRWALAQNNLGTALHTLAEREAGTARLEDAITAYMSALGEWTRERVPDDWAMAQDNIGGALRLLGERRHDSELLKDAVEAYRAALQERKRERQPLKWAQTQYNLGTALHALGEHEGDPVWLEQATAAYRAAQEIWTRQGAPLDWAMTQDVLGWTLVEIGRHSTGRANIDNGRQAIADAWAVYRDEGHDQYDDYFRTRIEHVEDLLLQLR